jgi:hypothetical protein
MARKNSLTRRYCLKFNFGLTVHQPVTVIERPGEDFEDLFVTDSSASTRRKSSMVDG